MLHIICIRTHWTFNMLQNTGPCCKSSGESRRVSAGVALGTSPRPLPWNFFQKRYYDIIWSSEIPFSYFGNKVIEKHWTTSLSWLKIKDYFTPDDILCPWNSICPLTWQWPTIVHPLWICPIIMTLCHCCRYSDLNFGGQEVKLQGQEVSHSQWHCQEIFIPTSHD